MHDYLLHIQQQVLCYVQGKGLHIHGHNWKINTHKKNREIYKSNSTFEANN